MSPQNSEPTSRIESYPETGQLEDSFLKLRVIIIDEEFYRGFRNKLYSSFQSGASVILYDMGLGYGELMGKNMKEARVSKLEIVKKFMELGKVKGYGLFQVPLLKTILSGIRGEPVVRVDNCFFATSTGNTGKVECYIMAGIIAGASQILLDTNYKCIEEKCLCKGDQYCEFKLHKV
jgi:predicted hydrocarbon binding protein